MSKNKVTSGDWIAALKSGDYTQGRGALRQRAEGGNDTFCCLGVLCDLIDPDGWDEAAFNGVVLYKENYGNVPDEVNNVLTGLNAQFMNALMTLNDRMSEPATFSDIAKVIYAFLGNNFTISEQGE